MKLLGPATLAVEMAEIDHQERCKLLVFEGDAARWARRVGVNRAASVSEQGLA